MVEELEIIEKNFKNMVETTKVDLSVIPLLEQFVLKLNKRKEEFEDKKNVVEIFPLFHVIETQIRVLEYMIERVKIAPENHDNPQVADDALIIIPQFKLIQEKINDKNSGSYALLNLASSLQITAMKSKMYPSFREVTSKIDREKLIINFERFTDRMGEEIERI